MPRGQAEQARRTSSDSGIFVASGVVLLVVALAILLHRRRMPGNPVAEIERALEAGEFIPYYQPIVDIRSGQLRGAEVLVRLLKPDGTLVLPWFVPFRSRNSAGSFVISPAI